MQKNIFSKKNIIIGFVILSLVYTFFTKKKKDMNLTEQQILDKTIPYILKMEGGLSNHTSDSASSYPSPTTQKWHTNKGITYKTFIDSASLGYQPTIKNFLDMPKEIWQKIYFEKYLKQANWIENPLLRVYISLWYWGGWNKKVVTKEQVLEVLKKEIPTDEKLKKLIELRILYFNKISTANPKLKVFLKGWINRANEFYQLFY